MSQDSDESPTEVLPLTQALPPTGVTRRTLIVAVIVASLLSIGMAVAISAAVLKEGPPGPRGPADRKDRQARRRSIRTSCGEPSKAIPTDSMN